jgi:hypothetical protein
MHTTEATKTMNGKTDGDCGIQPRHVPDWVVRARYAWAQDTGRHYLVSSRISAQRDPASVPWRIPERSLARPSFG